MRTVRPRFGSSGRWPTLTSLVRPSSASLAARWIPSRSASFGRCCCCWRWWPLYCLYLNINQLLRQRITLSAFANAVQTPIPLSNIFYFFFYVISFVKQQKKMLKMDQNISFIASLIADIICIRFLVFLFCSRSYSYVFILIFLLLVYAWHSQIAVSELLFFYLFFHFHFLNSHAHWSILLYFILFLLFNFWPIKRPVG